MQGAAASLNYTPSFKGSSGSSPRANLGQVANAATNVSKAKRIFLGSSAKKPQESVSHQEAVGVAVDRQSNRESVYGRINGLIQGPQEGVDYTSHAAHFGSSYLGSELPKNDLKYESHEDWKYGGAAVDYEQSSSLGLGSYQYEIHGSSNVPVAPISVDYSASHLDQEQKTEDIQKLIGTIDSHDHKYDWNSMDHHHHLEESHSGVYKLLEEANQKISKLQTDLFQKETELSGMHSTNEVLGNAEKIVMALKSRVEELEHENAQLASRGTLVVTDPDSQKIINELRNENRHLEIKVKELQKEIGSFQLSKGEQTHDLGQSRAKLEETLQLCEKLRVERQESLRRAESLQHEKSLLESELQRLKLQIQSSKHVVSTKLPMLETQVLAMNGEVKRKDQQIEAHGVEMSKVSSLEEALNGLMHENEKIRESHLAITAEFEKATRNLSQNQFEINSLKRDLLDSQERAANNLKEATKLQRENEKLRRTLGRLEEDLGNKEQLLINADSDGSRAKALMTQIEELRRAVKHLEQENGDLRYDSDNDQKRIASLSLLAEEKKKEIDEFVSAVRELKGELERLKVKNEGLAYDFKEASSRYRVLEEANHAVSAENAHLAHLNKNLERNVDDLLEQVRIWNHKFEAVEERLAFLNEMEIKMTGLARENVSLSNQIQSLFKKIEENEARLSLLSHVEAELKKKELIIVEINDRLQRATIERSNAVSLVNERELHSKNIHTSHEESIRELRRELTEVATDREHLLIKIEHLMAELQQMTKVEEDLERHGELLRRKEAVIAELEQKLGVLSEKFLALQKAAELGSRFEDELRRSSSVVEELETKLQIAVRENSQLREEVQIKNREQLSFSRAHQSESSEIQQKIKMVLEQNDALRASLKKYDDEKIQLALVIKRLEEENYRLESLLEEKGRVVEQATTQLREIQGKTMQMSARAEEYQRELIASEEWLKRENQRLVELCQSQRLEISELHGRLRVVEDVRSPRSVIGSEMRASRHVGENRTSRIITENERTLPRHFGLRLSENEKVLKF